MVIDTSALLTVYFKQQNHNQVVEQMNQHATSLRMSTVNLTETLILLEDKQPHLFTDIKDDLLHSSIRFVPPTAEQAEVAASARLRYPLNLGDCFAYALAKTEGCDILTTDHDFGVLDLPVILIA